MITKLLPNERLDDLQIKGYEIIQSPGRFCFGMDAVLLTQACADPLYRRASRVSMGTVFQIPWTYFDKSASWPDGAMDVLHKLGYKTAAMAHAWRRI